MILPASVAAERPLLLTDLTHHQLSGDEVVIPARDIYHTHDGAPYKLCRLAVQQSERAGDASAAGASPTQKDDKKTVQAATTVNFLDDNNDGGAVQYGVASDLGLHDGNACAESNNNNDFPSHQIVVSCFS